MSWWSRIANGIRGERVSREIEEESASHIEEAVERGRDPDEARRAFGPVLRQREESRDLRVIAWLDSLRADAVFGWRQLKKRKVTSAAAVLSLALAMGASTAAFRLVDALLLRPLPVEHPERLYALAREGFAIYGKPSWNDGWEYRIFRALRAAVKEQAELIAVSYTQRAELTYRSDQEMEKAHLEYVSGWMFGSFGLRPALGRLLTEDDDREPGAHPYAVLSYDYWSRRFGRDPQVIGRTFRMGDELFEIIGVAGERFTGTEPGTMTDLFLPTTMKDWVNRPEAVWLRVFVCLRLGVEMEPVRAHLSAAFRAFLLANGLKDRLNQVLVVEPAATGASDMQRAYGVPLGALGILVALVLLIACANVANLMMAQATARAREMALRVSIGAGRRRLVQLVVVESALVALLAAALGAVFAWRAAPFVVSRIHSPNDPARFVLPMDWRVLGFGAVLTLGVTLLFGLAPALRASAVRPASALKGGEDPHSRRRLLHGLVALQAAFCFLVLFVAGLFAATFDRLSHLPTGFSAERLAAVYVTAQREEPQALWEQVGEHLQRVPGVERVALAEWPLLEGYSFRFSSVSVDGVRPSENLTWLLRVAPGWMDEMKIPLLGGRDFGASDTFPSKAMVNQAFARQFFHGGNPVGKTFQTASGRMKGFRFQVVGLVGDARYQTLRDSISAVAYIPFRAVDEHGDLIQIRQAVFMVRTASANPMALASVLRQAVARARPEFRVSEIRTQEELNQSHTVRERLLAMLAVFFAAVALLLAGLGLYGVLDYSVIERRREIGIRMAIGAQAGDIARRVTADVFGMVLVGIVAGVGLGMASARLIAGLLYGVKATDAGALALPSLAILAVALAAAVPAVIRAVRIDPAAMLRSE